MTPNRPVVLLLTHQHDLYVVDRVAAALEERGARAIRVDTDLFPGDLGLHSIQDGAGMEYLLEYGEHTVRAREVAAVWTRSLWPPAVNEQIPSRHREACAAQTKHALEGFFDGLEGARWISPYPSLVRSSNKLRQQRLAVAAGWRTPRTLVTADPEQVRDFYRRLDGRVVTKLLHALGRSMDRSGDFMPTSDVTEEDLDHLDGLRLAPMIFQEKIPKARELRVKYVDGEAFIGATEASRTVEGATDWRVATGGRWLHGTLPDDARESLRRLMESLDLLAGAVDLIVTPEGEHVFLEVNPLGEWGMLERDLDLPISTAIAEALLADRG